LDALVALLQRVLLDLLKPDSPGEDLLLEAPRWLPSGESELKVAAMCASDLLELMTPEELCARLEPSSIPQLAADCPSSIAELAAAGVAIRTTNLLALERWALPRFDLTEFPFLDSPNGESLDVPLDRLGTAPLKYVHSAASGTYSVDFLIASFESPVVAAEEATGLPNGDLAGMTIVEKGELAAGPVSGYYAIGYDTAYNHWQTHSGLDSSMVRYASYQPQYYANASAHVCVRASVAFSIQEVLFAISFSWEDVRTDRVSLGFSPLAYPVTAIISVGQYGFSDGCIWHTATAKSPSQVLLCTETVLDQLKDLVDAQIEALKAALGE